MKIKNKKNKIAASVIIDDIRCKYGSLSRISLSGIKAAR
jgi:hypothetical protein